MYLASKKAKLQCNGPLYQIITHAIFAAMITAMDDGIGHVVDALKATDLWENTLFIFTSGLKVGFNLGLILIF